MNFNTLTQQVILEGAQQREAAAKKIKQNQEYAQQQWYLIKAGALLASGYAADKASRSLIGMPLIVLLRNIIVARVATEAVGTGISYLIDEEEGVDNWREASTTMFSWWGAEDLGWGPYNPLQYIPNPVGVGEIFFRSGMLLGEATSGGDGTRREYSNAQIEWYKTRYNMEPNNNPQGVPQYGAYQGYYDQGQRMRSNLDN